jgi:hypothetical protein
LSSQKSRTERAVLLVQQGRSLSDIQDALTSEGNIDLVRDAHFQQILRDKYDQDPSRDSLDTLDVEAFIPIIREEAYLDRVLLVEDLDAPMRAWTHPSRAYSQSGWSDADFIDAYWRFEKFRKLVALVVSVLMYGIDVNIDDVPTSQIVKRLFLRSGVALRKPGKPRDLRPCTWDEPIIKFAEGFLFSRSMEEYGYTFNPSQLGGSVAGGIEMAAHTARILLHKFPSKVWVRIDSFNAFNCLYTLAFLKVVAQNLSSFFPFLFSKYCTPSTMIFSMVVFIVGFRGVNQGGRASTGLFNMTLDELLDHMLSIGMHATLMSICDDVWLHADLEVALRAADYFIDRLAELGLSAAKSKLDVYGWDLQVKHSERILEDDNGGLYFLTRKGHRVNVLSNGFVVGGQPVGTNEYEKQYVSSLVDKVIEHLSLYKDMVNHGRDVTEASSSTMQAVIMLVISCTSSQINHVLRGVPPDNTRDSWKRLSNEILSCTKSITGIADFEAKHLPLPDFLADRYRISRRLLLNKGKGGCGIPGDSPDPSDRWCSANAAYCGSLALCLASINKRFFGSDTPAGQLTPEDCSTLPNLIAFETARNAIRDSIPDHFHFTDLSENLQELCTSLSWEEILQHPVPKMQHKLRQVYQLYSQRVVIQGLPQPRKQSVRCEGPPRSAADLETQSNDVAPGTAPVPTSPAANTPVIDIRYLTRDDFVKAVWFMSSIKNHHFISYSMDRGREAVRFTDDQFGFLFRTRAGIPIVPTVSAPTVQPLEACSFCNTSFWTEGHAMLCRVTAPQANKQELHTEIQETLRWFLRQAGFIIHQEQTVSRFLPTTRLRAGASQCGMTLRTDLVVEVPESLRHSQSLPRWLFIDLTFPCSFKGIPNKCFFYKGPPMRAEEASAAKARHYTTYFDFEGSSGDEINSKSLVIFAFEVPGGSFTPEVNGFLTMLSLVLADSHPRTTAEDWKARMIITFQKLLSRSVADRYLVRLKSQHNAANIRGPASPNQSSAAAQLSLSHSGSELVATSLRPDVPPKSKSNLSTRRSVWDQIIMGPPLSPSERQHIDSVARNPNTFIIYTDGSYKKSKNDIISSGCAWARFTNDGPQVGVISSRAQQVDEAFGPWDPKASDTKWPPCSEDIARRLPRDYLDDFGLVRSGGHISSVTAELYAIICALINVYAPDLISRPILVRYDSACAKGFLTKQFVSTDPHLLPIIRLGQEVLLDLNNHRRQMILEQANTRFASEELGSNAICFQWVKAHTQREYGNAWVDCRAKSGRHGFSNRNPPPERFLTEALSLVLQTLSSTSVVPPLDTDTFLDDEDPSQRDAIAPNQLATIDVADSREPGSEFLSVIEIIDHLPGEIDLYDEEVVDRLLSNSSEQDYLYIPTSAEIAQSSMTVSECYDERL